MICICICVVVWSVIGGSVSQNMDQLSIQDDADAQWLKERGVPSFEEPFLQKYLQGRDALIDQEKKQRSGQSRTIIAEI